jgi:peptidoglycan/LPS O-acetylase OafA/YrhL
MKERAIYRGDIRELDGLRGIAILLVMVHHFWPGGDTPIGRYGELGHLGWMGVDLFFVISGFLICGILLDTVGSPGYFKNFYARRSLRIFPLYYAFLIFVFIVVPAAQSGAGYFAKAFIRESGNLLWYFLYAGNIREAITNQHPAYFLAPLWSLSIEEQFYISFPFIIAATGKEKLWKLLCGLILFAPLFRSFAVLVIPSLSRMPYLATFSRVDVISLGCLIALGFRTGRITITVRRFVPFLAAALILAMVILFHFGGLDRRSIMCKIGGYSLTAFMFGSIVLTAVLFRGTASMAFLRWKPLTSVGKICYGSYLLHRPTEVFLLKAMQRAGLPTPDEAIWLLLLKILATLVVASLSWWLFESRILRLKERFNSETRTQAAQYGVCG